MLSGGSRYVLCILCTHDVDRNSKGSYKWVHVAV